MSLKVYMFPGQGSQRKGMGDTLFDEFPEYLTCANNILGYSLKELCIYNPDNQLNNTRFTQVALYVVNALRYLKTSQDPKSPKPDYFIGHSLGEFNALLAAECFDFETGLRIVEKRGELMAQINNGGMGAVLNTTQTAIEGILKKSNLNNVDFANFNSPSQIVISGMKDELKIAENIFTENQIDYIPLNTSGAFHSRFMEPAKIKFSKFLNTFKLSKPKIPVIANFNALPYSEDNLQLNLSSQITGAVKWVSSVEYLLSVAKKAESDIDFIEIGQTEILKKFVKDIKEYGSTGNNENSELPSLREDATKKAEEWNKIYPIGSNFYSKALGYNMLETRTKAVVLFGHRVAVYMKNYNAYFGLEDISPA